jgi:predicted metal-dependent hydrolase
VIEYTLTRSKRKTAAIYIRDGAVEVRAPLKMPKRDIDKFVASKEAWIKSKLTASRERLVQKQAFSLNYGDAILYRGREYPIAAKDGDRIGFDDTVFYMPPNLSPHKIKLACVKIYRMLAGRDLTARTLDFAERMSVAPAAVKINGAKTRWGSCSSRQSINFSWRLIMASDDVIDYVVVHELAHLLELNHSKNFWAIVESVLPDYKERQERLRELQKRLAAEDWGI